MIDIQLEYHNVMDISIVNLETLYDQIKRVHELKLILKAEWVCLTNCAINESGVRITSILAKSYVYLEPKRHYLLKRNSCHILKCASTNLDNICKRCVGTNHITWKCQELNHAQQKCKWEHISI